VLKKRAKIFFEKLPRLARKFSKDNFVGNNIKNIRV
jgi:hypothetical protein